MEEFDIRSAARKKAEDNSKYNDMKQHADKLIQGFQKLNDSHAKRAIWELFQNAIDLSDKAQIIIEQKSDSLVFKHNGKPFDDNTLNCLIKQVSSKSAESNDDEIGQYGTGFITTHSFGRKILLSGSLKNDNSFISLNGFEIDRTAKTSPDLILDLVKQQNAVFDLIENGAYLKDCAPFTEFAYISESKLQQQYVIDSISSLPYILPYVMVLNRKLHEVKVIDIDNHAKVYTKGETIQNGIFFKSEIIIDGVSKFILSIENEDPQITVILPITAEYEALLLNEQLSKLFLFYPLIGTETWGMNYIIHSKHFFPTEQRDGIYLNSLTEQVKENEEENRKLILKASEMIFSFVRDYASEIKNPINLAEINFNVNSDKPLLNDYFKSLKSIWIEQFKTFPLVETNAGNLQPSESNFVDKELLVSELHNDAIYNLVSKYWKNIPVRKISNEWTKKIDEWNIESINYLKIKDLVENIQEDSALKAFEKPEEIKQFYGFLLENGHEGLFNQYALLPNIKGDFKQFAALNKIANLPQTLIEIADVLMPEITARHIDNDFKFGLELSDYSRKQYSIDINGQIIKLVTDNTTSSDLPYEFLEKLVNYCNISSSSDANNAPGKIMKLISNYYKISDNIIIIPNIKDDEINIGPSQRRLLRMFLNDLSNQEPSWVEENIDFLHSLHELGSYKDYEEMFLTLKIFPNQLNELESQTFLKIEYDIPDEIKQYYDDIVQPNVPIKATFIRRDFAKYLKNKEVKAARSLAEAIESVLSNDGQYSDVIGHKFQLKIYEILQKIIQDTTWASYFYTLNGRRANIVLDSVSDDNIIGDVFSIVSLEPEQINKLGVLARDKNFDQIIALGRQALEDKSKIDSDFLFKKAIGTRIEALIRNKIGLHLSKFNIKPRDVQNGQDIVISIDDKEVFYIEVKSRWNSDNSIMMSKNQFMNAAKNKSIYSLCCVEMSNYRKDEPNRYEVEDVEIIFDRIKFCNTIGSELEPLINGMLVNTDINNDITLTGDYKATIPQRIIKNGQSIDDFIIYLISTLKLGNNK